MGRWAKKSQKNTLNSDVYKRLSAMFEAGKGRSRNEDKRTGKDRDYIYTSRTYETYKRESKHFVSWIIANYPDVKHLSQGKKLVDTWLKEQIDNGMSPYTISTRKAAIAKLYGMSAADLIKTPPRTRESITRSREAVKNDTHISKTIEAKWGSITSAIGLRRAELARVRGTDLITTKDIDGNNVYWVHVHSGTKGGKSRIAIVCGTDQGDNERIAEMFRRSGTDKVFGKIPRAYDNHHYRAEYAKRVYNRLARNKDQIRGKDRYVMRKDRAGEVFDRKAMAEVSKYLGHNRVDVIAEHYLY